jgi:hypothetical protein
MTLSWQTLRILVGLAFVAGWIWVFGPATFPLAPTVVQTLDPTEIKLSGGNAYYVVFSKAPALPIFGTGGDNPSQPWGSDLEILENGARLGPAHTMHSTVANTGKGAYSHWGTSQDSIVLFSTSDNTDPRTNGRQYTISVQPRVSFLLFAVIVLPLSALLLHWLLGPWLNYATVALAAVALVAWLWLFGGHLMLSPDSTTYTQWLALVPLGYPLFLSAIKVGLGSFTWISTIQATLMVGACLFLALAVARVSQRRVTGFVTLLLLLCYLPMFSAADHILSEALFVPLILINVGAALRLIAEPRIPYAIVLALTAALIMFVRPAGYYAPLGAVFLAIAMASRFRWMLKWAIAPMIAFILATLLVNTAVRGTTSVSQVGRILFPHIAFIFDPNLVTGPDREFADVVDEALKPHRALYAQAPTLTERFRFSMNNYNPRLSSTDRAVHLKLGRKSGYQESDEDFRKLERLYVSFFLTTVLHKPMDYVRLARDQIVGGWQLSVMLDGGPFAQTYISNATANYPDGVKAINAAKLPIPEQALLPNSAALEAFPGRFIDFLEAMYKRLRALRPLIYAMAIISLLAIPVALLAGRRSRHWLSLAYLGVIIHGSVLLTTTVTVFIPRYAMPVDPLILVAGVILVDMVFTFGRNAVVALASWRKPASSAAASVSGDP